MEELNDQRGTQAVHRALRMLEAFEPDCGELLLSELAAHARLTLPTAHRIVRSLHARGFVVQAGSDRTYSLGPAVMRLARTLLHDVTPHNLIQLAYPYLERLRDETGETAALYSTLDDARMCVAEAASPQPIRMANGVGNLYPLDSGAAGKAILAWQPTERIDRILAGHPDEGRLRREFGRIRKRGFAISIGETVPAASAVASAVRGPDGGSIGAISIAGPSERWSRTHMTAIVPILADLVGRLADEIGAQDQS